MLLRMQEEGVGGSGECTALQNKKEINHGKENMP
ncbi:MAG: hypothetical protein Ta2B_12170 [Termitinemataceae bacterium]|nr:MAG: hypothetical protein Ta2B_12170 [Termitinemataceae bacterium]